MMTFSGKVVIVTGAGSGIGAATALLFAKEGARVALVDRNEATLGNIAQQCAQHVVQPLVIKADLANEQEASTIVQKTVDHFGKLDVLVNNAGIFRGAAVGDPNILQVFDEVMKTNLRAVVQLTSLAVPHLAATKGNIVSVSSVAAHIVVGMNYMPYSVSKAGVDHFTRCAALDLMECGVRVNSVNPGWVRTNIIENSSLAPAAGGATEKNQAEESTASKFKIAEPEDIAEVIAFLASDKARSITGSNCVANINGPMLRINV